MFITQTNVSQETDHVLMIVLFLDHNEEWAKNAKCVLREALMERS